jgi:hypothetical protein
VADAPAIDRDEVDLFERSLRGLLDQPQADVAAALDASGWRDFLAVDAPSVVPVVFHLHGERVLASGALDDVVFEALGDTGVELRATTAAFVHPLRAADAGAQRDGDLLVDGVLLADCSDATVAVVAGARIVTVPASALERSTVHGIDPALGLVRARGMVSLAGLAMTDDVDTAALTHACRRALAHELLGAVDSMLTSATEYAGVRQQFGQPIGAFQAVKHRLADVYVARQAADAVLQESWRSDPECTTLAAKALAAHAGALASEHCLQVFGAIGFTLEHDLHRFVRRVRVLDRLYGSEAALRIELGRLLQRRGRVPRPGAA